MIAWTGYATEIPFMYEVGSDNQGGTEPSDDEAPVLASASLVIDGLEAGTEYTFYVKAKDAAGNYAASGQLYMQEQLATMTAQLHLAVECMWLRLMELYRR